MDFGCGSGYFVAAMKKMGFKNICGTDPSESQVGFGNAMIGELILTPHKLEDTDKLLGDAKSQVVSMIGVLEHLKRPRAAMKQLRANNNVKFIFISVPLFSLAVYLEMLSPEIYHRQLTEGHTHLYTEESLLHLCKEFGFDVISEWWFGTDVLDLYRHIFVTIKANSGSKRMLEKWRQNMMSVLDALQLEIDKKHFSSEVQMVLKKV